MKQYLGLLRHIRDNGVRKQNRTGVDTLAVFGHQMRFDLSAGFPLVTTKKIHVKSIIFELLWMLNGDTSVKFLRDNGVTIWDEWAAADYLPELGYPEGELGPVYGSQWRRWQGLRSAGLHATAPQPSYDHVDEFDQLADIVDKLRNKPDDRRMLLTSWNVAAIRHMKLPPCHLLAQFDATRNRVSCHMYIRSWDVFLGGPFNIAQYGFLTHLLAHATGLGVGELVISSGDTHLYVNHLDQVEEQLGREPRPLPKLTITERGQNILSEAHGHAKDGYEYDDFVLEDYDPHPHIKADVAV